VTKSTGDKHFRSSDLIGVSQLLTQATRGITDLVEDVHSSVLNRAGLTDLGVSKQVYRVIRGMTKLLGGGSTRALRELLPDPGASNDAESIERERMLAALNGVIGDRLSAEDNPLAVPMTVRPRGRELSQETASGRVLLMVHGLCLSACHWFPSGEEQGSAHGEILASELDLTPIYLRYNSGRHVTHNGQDLALLLDDVLDNWPVPLEELNILCHSMGGLITRSAVHHAETSGRKWRRKLKRIVFLGTPHHGTPLEQVGNWLHALLRFNPYTLPFVRLARLRSSGITDLRYGHVLDHDRDRFALGPDNRDELPLPQDVACYALAATRSRGGEGSHRYQSDGLVTVDSALGCHSDDRLDLNFAESRQTIMPGMSHMELLRRDEVTQKLKAWFA